MPNVYGRVVARLWVRVTRIAPFVACLLVHLFTLPTYASELAGEIRVVPGLDEPLVATGVHTPAEDLALGLAIKEFAAPVPDDVDITVRTRRLEAFLGAHPTSAWKLSLLTNLGSAYYREGHFTKAITSWQQAWRTGRTFQEPQAKAQTDRAVGELARMYARVGYADALQALFAEMGDRPISGPATEMITGAREGLWMFRNEPGISYLCGPMALRNLLINMKGDQRSIQALMAERSGPKGYTLKQVSDLALRSGLPHELIVRTSSDQPIPVPSIINWKLNHYAAIIEERGGRYRIQDPTFASGDLWVTKHAIDAESSGYFLAPSSAIASVNWRKASSAEAQHVYGMGFTSVNEPGATKPDDTDLNPSCGTGMCVVNAKLSAVSLNLKDSPIGYTPQLGPDMRIRISYNQRESSQPSVFGFFNLSPKWSMNFMSWIQDNPNSAGNSVYRITGGGGYVDYNVSPYSYNGSTGQFTPDKQGQAVLVRIPATGAVTRYEWRLPDGSKYVYARSDGSTSNPRRVFLTGIVDAAGNAVTLNYDAQLRLVSIVDATGRATSIGYELAARPLLITSITDPFGRTARIAYDSNGRLSTITDVIGIQSVFSYDNGGLVNTMRTPYGTSRFSYGDGSDASRFLEITDPLGYAERIEFRHTSSGLPYSDPVAPPGYDNIYLYYRNTFHWDKHAYPLTGRDFTRAKIFHWLHNSAGQTSSLLESTKLPLENRVWMKYPGQGSGISEGSTGTPIATARVLDNGATQASSYSYNALGLPLTMVDPSGRRTVFTYAANNIDLLTVQQQINSSGALVTLASYTYNSQHKPLTETDASGRTTVYAYNPAGQVISKTNALNQVSQYEYDNLGRLSKIINANNRAAITITYDGFDRVATTTDSEGYVQSYGYDALDRITAITYPDATTTEYTYLNLDLVRSKDRLGRVTAYGYDANRRLVSITSAIGQVTQFSYYNNGALRTITDPNGNVTTWFVDIQGRPTSKRYADGRTETYSYEASIGRLKSILDPLGQTRSYSYFNDNFLKSVVYTGARNPTPNVNFTYDAFFPRRTSMTDGVGRTTWSYHAPGGLGALLVSVEDGPYTNDVINHTYDALGRLATRTVGGIGETFSYDSLGRTAGHSSRLGTFTSEYLGDTDQLVRRRATGSNITTQWAYAANAQDRRLLSIVHSGAARTFNFSTTPESLITGISESVGGMVQRSWSYTYDEVNRLVSGRSSAGTVFPYGYDGSGNLTSINGKVATYNANNQVSSLGQSTYSYDANGNLLNDGVRAYAWDAENRLVGIGYAGAPAKSTGFRYDGLGRRLAIIDANAGVSTESRYLWCGDSLCQARGVNDDVTRLYYPEGVVMPASGTSLYYEVDQIGSVRGAISFPGGSKVASYDYDPYGNPTASSGRLTVDHRFAGMLYHGMSGIYLTNYRAYDPKSARWLSRDPIREAGGINIYAYVGGNPISYVDPTGLECNGSGCWLTANESSLAAAGNYSGYYAAACSGGDVYACAAGRVAANQGWSANFTNWRLRNSLKGNGASDSQCDAKMESIRVDLAEAHADALRRGSPQSPIVLTASQISAFHNNIFSQHGAGAVFGGDIPFSNFFFSWCSLPSCRQ